MIAQEQTERCMARLRELPFVEHLDLTAQPDLQLGFRPDYCLEIRTAGGAWPFLLDVKTTHLTYAVAEGFVLRAGQTPDQPWMLCAPYIPRHIGNFLVEKEQCFVDTVGNCYVALGREHIALIQGRTAPKRAGRGRGMGLAGYKVLFALLAEPRLLERPIRDFAAEVGVGKTAVAHTLERLEEEGLIGRGVKHRQVLALTPILDKWLVGYENLVRPRLRIGTFRTLDPDPDALEARVEVELEKDPNWAWGGGAAAMRLTGYYRGENTVLYHDHPPPDLHRRLRAIPAHDGPLTILRTPGKIALRGELPRTVHPLLVYTELVGEQNERAREAAANIRDRFIQGLP